jgi:hypothetical protein
MAYVEIAGDGVLTLHRLVNLDGLTALRANELRLLVVLLQ